MSGPLEFPTLDAREMAIGNSNAATLGVMLDNPEADKLASGHAVADAVARGVTPDRAVYLYGVPR